MFNKPSRRASRRVINAVGAVFVVVAASCGGDDDSSDIEPDATAEAAAPVDTDAGATPEPEGTDVAESATSTAQTDASTGSADTAGTSGSTPSGPADESLEPVRIGWSSVDIGPGSLPEATMGMEAGVAYVNAELGGIDGHPIELVTCSVGTDPESNQACAQEFANDEELDLVITGLIFNGAPLYNALTASGTPVLNMTYLTPADIADPGPTAVYSGGQLVTFSMGTIMSEVVPDLSSVGIIEVDTQSSKTGTANATTVLEGQGVEVKVATIPLASPDALGAITALGDVDGYINLAGSPETCVQVANALDSIAPDAVVVATVTCADGPIVEQVGDAVDGWFVSTPNKVPTAANADTDADIIEFVDNFEEYGGDAQYLGARFAASSFGMAVTAANALRGVGVDTFSDETITEALTSYTGPVLMGPPAISCPGEFAPNLCTDQVYVYEVVDGQLDIPDFGGGLIEVHVD